MRKQKDDWLLVPVDKQPKGLQYLEIFKWRMEQMRGRAGLMTAAQWGFRLNCSAKTCRSMAARLKEECKTRTLACEELILDQRDGLTAQDKKLMFWARKPWGDQDAAEEARLYLEELLDGDQSDSELRGAD